MDIENGESITIWQNSLDNKTNFSDVYLIGTHHSDTTNITFDIKIDSAFQYAANTYFLRPLLKKYTICQNKTITQQLNDGIRVFDIRLAKYNDEIYTAHSFYTTPLFPILTDIYAFLTANPSEFVILNLTKDHVNKKTIKTSEINSAFNKHILSSLLYTGNHYTSVDNLRGKVIIEDNLNINKTKWFNTNLVSKVNSSIKEADMKLIPNTTNKIGVILTPQTVDIVINIVSFITFLTGGILTIFFHDITSAILLSVLILFSLLIHLKWNSSIKCMSKKVNKLLKKEYIKNYNIIMVDYYDDKCVKRIVGLNSS